MPLNFTGKQAVVAEVNAVASKALSLVAMEYHGIKAVDLDKLRAKVRATGGELRVVKNTLAAKAFEGTEFAAISDKLTGPLLLGFALDDPGSVARVVKDFAKTTPALKVQHLAVGGQVYPGADIDKLAELPTRDQALGMLAGLMIAPVTRLVRTLAEPAAMLARTVAAIRDQKGE